MPVNMVNPYANAHTVDDVRKVMDDLKSKGQSVNPTNSHEPAQRFSYNNVLTPQAVGPAAKVDISKQAKQTAAPEEAVADTGNKKKPVKEANPYANAHTAADIKKVTNSRMKELKATISKGNEGLNIVA